MKAETAGEAAILARIREPGNIVLGDLAADRVTAPDHAPSDETTVRAEFLRHYLTDGTLPDGSRGTPRWGLRLANAYVTGPLNLTGTSAIGEPIIGYSRFDAPIEMSAARFVSVNIQNSTFPGLVAQRMACEGNFKADGVRCEGRISLAGALVRGQVNFKAARIGPEPGGDEDAPVHALDLQNLEAGGNVSLCSDGLEGATFVARGGVNLSGAAVGGQLTLTGGHFHPGTETTALNCQNCDVKGDVFMISLPAPDGWAPAEGRVRNEFISRGSISFQDATLRDVRTTGAVFLPRPLPGGGRSGGLDFEGARVSGSLRLDETKTFGIGLDLRGARIGRLFDGPKGWPPPGTLFLDQATYTTFAGAIGTRTLAARRDWLNLQPASEIDGEFKPQPWEQCAKVLREMGHVDDARELMIEKERLQRRARRRRHWSDGRDFAWARATVGDALLGWTTRYGRQPLRAVNWLVAFFLVGAGVFWATYEARAFKPNNPFILRAPEWVLCDPGLRAEGAALASTARAPRLLARDGETQLDCFDRQAEAKGYPAFNALVYSADTLLPIVQLEMQQFWIPDAAAASPWGRAARLFLWFQIVAGWALSLLAVAGFSGLIKQDSA